MMMLNQKIPERLIEITFLGRVETAVRSGMRSFGAYVFLFNNSVQVSLLYGKGLGREGKTQIRVGRRFLGLSPLGEVRRRGDGTAGTAQNKSWDRTGRRVVRMGHLQGIMSLLFVVEAPQVPAALPAKGQDRVALVITGRTDLLVVSV